MSHELSLRQAWTDRLTTRTKPESQNWPQIKNMWEIQWLYTLQLKKLYGICYIHFIPLPCQFKRSTALICKTPALVCSTWGLSGCLKQMDHTGIMGSYSPDQHCLTDDLLIAATQLPATGAFISRNALASFVKVVLILPAKIGICQVQPHTGWCIALVHRQIIFQLVCMQ